MTRLVTVAHGTRRPVGATAPVLTRAAGTALGLTAVAAYVELQAPLLTDVLTGCDEPTVVVPLLLSTGFHVRHDLPEMLGHAAGPARLGRPLGPHPLLARAQAARLREAGATPGQPVVLVAAGSRDPAAAPDLAAAVRHLALAWGGPVSLATLSGPGSRPAEVVTPDHAVSPYLLSPGYFAERTVTEAAASAHVADVIGVHPCVVELLVERARTALRELERPAA